MYPINSVLNTAVLEVSVAGKPKDQLLLDIYLSVRDEHKGKYVAGDRKYLYLQQVLTNELEEFMRQPEQSTGTSGQKRKSTAKEKHAGKRLRPSLPNEDIH